MSAIDPTADRMRAVRFHGYGEPGTVLTQDETTVPNPGRGEVRAKVQACGLNPADWALC